MKYTSFICAILLATAFAEIPEEDNVMVLNTEDFNTVIESHKYVLVEFYAPWCGHCKKLTPEYAAAAAELKKVGEGYVPLGKVDATVETTVAEKFGVQGYPTLKFFVNGQPIDYEGGRTAGDIVAWITKKTGPPTQELKTLEEVTEFIAKASTSPVVVFFGQSEDDSDFVTFKSFAQTNDKVIFAHTFEEAAKETHAAATKIVLFKGFDEKRNDFEGAITAATLEAFLNTNSAPTLLPFNDKAISVIFQQKNNAIFLFIDDTDAGASAFDAFAKVAGGYRDKLKFSFSKSNDGFGLFSRLGEYIGASTTELPNIMLFDQATNAKFRFSGEITVDSLREFVDSFVAGTLSRYMKTEEIPATNDEPVKIIVGKNFKDLVVDNDKDVLVEFYAPWCGHCKQLAPIYDALAKKLLVNSKITIAKCDSTANEIDGVTVESFPTIKFFKNGQKTSPIDYNGARDEAGFLKWLEENVSHPWVDLERAEEL